MSIPSLSTHALGYGAFLGLYANLRYQLLYGIDRAMFNHFDVLGVVLCFTTALRYGWSIYFIAHIHTLITCNLSRNLFLFTIF